MKIKEKPKVTLFCDLDGVLVDFERGFELFYGVPWNSVPEEDMWRKIEARERHWHDLPAIPGALKLWAKIAPLAPVILTGCPQIGYEYAEAGKREWCARELGEDVEVITCRSRNKPNFLRNKGDILIDDLIKNCNRWKEAGGIAIQHKNADETIRQLEALGY